MKTPFLPFSRSIMMVTGRTICICRHRRILSPINSLKLLVAVGVPEISRIVALKPIQPAEQVRIRSRTRKAGPCVWFHGLGQHDSKPYLVRRKIQSIREATHEHPAVVCPCSTVRTVLPPSDLSWLSMRRNIIPPAAHVFVD